MEDILASIRRILSDDEAAPPTAAAPAESVAPAVPTPAITAAPPPPLPSPAAPPPARAVSLPPLVAAPMESDDVLSLDASMLVAESPSAAPPPPSPPPPSSAPPASGLVAPAAAAAAASSVGSLVRTLIAGREQVAVHRGGPTIEDVVREELRPILKLWLDTNLPPLVERLVQAEIERVVSRTSA
jgi:cell pole-organizing protein PopZ